jgi:hypothetical protein
MPTQTFTAGEIVTAAFRKIAVQSKDQAVETEDMAEGLRVLNWMLKAWQAKRYLTWTFTAGSLTLSTDAEYTLDPVRPLRILNARLKRAGVELPMHEMTRDEYDTLPVKTTTGVPTQFHYNRQREAARFFVWPVLSAVNGETVEYTYERELADIAGAADVLDMPVEWHECVIYNLAARLADDYQITAPKVDARAEMMLQDLLADDREESVYFGPEY